MNHFLQNPNSPYHIRAVTRNPLSEKSRALSALGAEVVKGDLDDETSLKAAINGAHTVFLVTDFWTNPTEPEKEKEQAKRAITILANSPTLKHLIWSSLPSITKASGGKYSGVIHFDGKAEITEWIPKAYPELWAKTTVLWVGAYCQIWKQFRDMFAPKKNIIDGKEVWLQMATAKEETIFPMVDVRETGKVVAAILKRGKELGGHTVSMLGDEEHTIGDNLRTWGRIVGKDVAFKTMPESQYEEHLRAQSMPEFLLQDIAQTPLAFRDFEGKIYRAKGVILANDEVGPRSCMLGRDS